MRLNLANLVMLGPSNYAHRSNDEYHYSASRTWRSSSGFEAVERVDGFSVKSRQAPWLQQLLDRFSNSRKVLDQKNT